MKIKMELKDIIEERQAATMEYFKGNIDKGNTLHCNTKYLKDQIAETAQIVAREVRDSLVKVVDDYEKDITKLHHRMMGTAHDDCKEMLAFDMHSRLIAVKHIKEKIDKEFTHLQSLEEELETKK
jgi:hypothetical protein